MAQHKPDNGHWVRQAVDRYHRPLLLYAVRLLGDGEHARDVVQETFCRLCDQREEELDGRLAAWLYTVCRHRAVDIMRKEKRMTTLTDTAANAAMNTGSDSTMELQLAGESTDPADAAERGETVSHMLQLVETLPESQQEVIRLKFQHSLSYKQISEVTGQSVSNVGFLLHRGLKTIREKMTDGDESATKNIDSPHTDGEGESR